MTQMKNLMPQTGRLFTMLGVCTAFTMTSATPLFAQDTVVEGKAKRSDLVEQRVSYTDLNLMDQSNHLILISRVKKAAGKVCDKIYSGQAPMMKFESGCTYDVYRNAKPQIDMAIANAGSGTRVAINLTAKRGN